MDGVRHALFDVAMLQDLLRERLEGRPVASVAEVLQAFLDVAAMSCDRKLWSLEFSFDSDDSRIARLAAAFAPRHATAPEAEDMTGFEVHVLLPKLLPARTMDDGCAALEAPTGAATAEKLVARFLVMLTDLGAYRTIELLEPRSVTVFAS